MIFFQVPSQAQINHLSLRVVALSIFCVIFQRNSFLSHGSPFAVNNKANESEYDTPTALEEYIRDGGAHLLDSGSITHLLLKPDPLARPQSLTLSNSPKSSANYPPAYPPAFYLHRGNMGNTGWVCCSCSNDNSGAVIWCSQCKHYTVSCLDCFSYREGPGKTSEKVPLKKEKESSTKGKSRSAGEKGQCRGTGPERGSHA